MVVWSEGRGKGRIKHKIKEGGKMREEKKYIYFTVEYQRWVLYMILVFIIAILYLILKSGTQN